MVDHDLEKNEPFIQLTLAVPDESDLTDKILRHFVERAKEGIKITYPHGLDNNNNPQIRIGQPMNVLTEDSIDFRDWLISEGIEFKIFNPGVVIKQHLDFFNLGAHWGVRRKTVREYRSIRLKEEDAVAQIEALRYKVKKWIGKEHDATDQIFDSLVAKVSVNILKELDVVVPD